MKSDREARERIEISHTSVAISSRESCPTNTLSGRCSMSNPLIESLARKLYEARHSPPQHPTWDELQSQKTYKLKKYRQLAEVAIAFLQGVAQP